MPWPSADHTRSPTAVAPGVSFGPRWSATAEQQNSQCLQCHGDDAARHWEGAHHQRQDLSCVTCHDIHITGDPVMQPATQREVCTVCHKEQQSGIHEMERAASFNPPCSSCHSPHDRQSPHQVMLGNRSAGCAGCHNLVAMADDPQVSPKATSYHKVMAQQDKSCLNCHVGIAHGTAEGVAAQVREARNARRLTLFYPGQSDSEWLLSEHPGSQPLRQGSNCQQCHRGEEADMGKALAGDGVAAVSRDISIGFARRGDELEIEISWRGPADDQDIALMWGDGRNEAFSSAGCFAACHSDMPGMTRDRGQQMDKYLLASRLQQRQIGRPAIVRDEAALARLREAGNFAELWRVKLQRQAATVETATVLAQLEWHPATLVTASASHSDGRWRVSLRRQLQGGSGSLDFASAQQMTFGVALHGADRPGGKHWVSLPQTFSMGATHTDFKAQ
ncbi:cytochrome c3 family protein [Kineobactrum salinum]|uniref:Uncharacterized protein n=1 Tax=Kineobactrum salinum TaxID=2708301 RepID=A0A6C0U2Q1_9GAMM|nr:cytochrome c3 family protein [Kineobactrum salinum]QIB66371.1 hypothetical protein G3T16_14180 [Kineobactrum salinum]